MKSDVIAVTSRFNDHNFKGWWEHCGITTTFDEAYPNNPA